MTITRPPPPEPPLMSMPTPPVPKSDGRVIGGGPDLIGVGGRATGGGEGGVGGGMCSGGGGGAEIGGLRLRPSAKTGLAAENTIRPAARRLSSFIGVFLTSVGRAMQRPCRTRR